MKFFSENLKLPLGSQDDIKGLAQFRLSRGELFEVFGPKNRERKEKYRYFNGPALGFEVENLEKAHKEMARGVYFITDVETSAGSAWALFLGPEDKLFQIQQPAQKYPENIAKITGFAGAGVSMKNFTEGVLFFSQVMNIKISHQEASSELAQFNLPSSQLLEVFGPNNYWGKQTPHAIVAFAVENVRKLQQELQSSGIEFVGSVDVSPSDKVFTHLRDPNGYLYKLCQSAKVLA